MMIERRSLLRGLFAMPAVIVASSLMPLRGVPLVIAENIDPNLIAAILDQRLDLGWETLPLPYHANDAFARYQGYEHVEAKLGLCADHSSEEWRERRSKYDRACIAYMKGEGPMPPDYADPPWPHAIVRL